MKTIISIAAALILLFPAAANAQLTVPQGGTGTTTVPSGWFVVGNSQLRLTGQQFVDLAADVSGTLPTGNGGYSNSLVNAYIHASTTIPKLYTGNLWTGAQTIAASLLNITGLSDGCLQIASNILTSTGSACGSGGGSSYTFTYPLVNTAGTVSLAFGTTTSNTWAGTQTFTNAPVLGSLSGILKAASGVLSAAVAGTDYEVPLTFSTGLTRSTNTITVNTTQNITKLSNLTGNGFVKTSGGDGTLSVDTTTYLSSAVQTLVLPQGSFSGNLTIATTSNTTNGITSTLTAVGSGSTITFSSNQSGTLTVAGGGTGVATLTGLVKGNGTSAFTAAVNGTDFTLITAKTCTAGDFVSSLTAAGVFTCTTPAAGGSARVATSSAETSGYIPFWTSTSAGTATLSGGTSNFVWDSANARLGIGTASPAASLNLLGSAPSARTVAYATTTYSTPGSFTYTPPPNIYRYKVYMWGGGGAGSGGNSGQGFSGGGSAAYHSATFTAYGGAVGVTVGAGGVGSTVTANATSGSYSAFGSLASVCGGGASVSIGTGGTYAGGSCGPNSTSTGTGGRGGNGNASTGQGGGSSAGFSGNGNSGSDTAAIITGGAASGATSVDSGAGGTGCNGAPCAGSPGTQPGAGGGGADTGSGAQPGGNGAAGRVVVVAEYYSTVPSSIFRIDTPTLAALNITQEGEVQIGTTSPTVAAFSVANTGKTIISLLQGVLSSVNYVFEVIDQYGHLIIGGPQPAVSTCGTGPTLGGSDRAGTIFVGTGTVTACTVTFANAYAATPSCVATVQGALAYAYVSSLSTTALTITTSASVGAQKIVYQCFQN